MAGETISPNMNLVIPAVGTTDWLDAAPDINSSLTLIDQHNHASGNGVAISPPGLNINEDLSFQSNDAVDLRSTRFTSNLSPISDPSDLGCLYVAGVDLYYNDEDGNQIRITASGGVAGSPGSIGNLTPPASVTYVSSTPAYVFQSDANTSADLDGGSLTIRENVANAKGITLSSPTGLANDYTLTFPGALPGSNKIMRLDASGNISATLGVDGSTIVISSNNLSVGTITDSQIAAGSINGDRLVAASVTTTQIMSNAVFNGTGFGLNDAKPNFERIGNTFDIGGVADKTLVVGYSNSSSKGYRIISGWVDSSGGLVAGEGFTPSRLAQGQYQIVLTIASSNRIITTVSPIDNSSGRITAKIDNTGSSTTFQVFTSDAGGLLQDFAFNFIAVVPVA